MHTGSIREDEQQKVLGGFGPRGTPTIAVVLTTTSRTELTFQPLSLRWRRPSRSIHLHDFETRRPRLSAAKWNNVS